ncbi:CocE/NonD family hydrolase [Steroidobacter sp.]|uniref:CocE/NonD family hydrolase n=1 Tax=Steroidobacter sp. TaxID=1978227 RepID=UPI001A5DBD6F|nr:CocE/NonD family hydrolase [Steroidobacter sp.]MBL8266307.1 CocE/NonD family hydrolase [Steroidobacter sp.]
MSRAGLKYTLLGTAIGIALAIASAEAADVVADRNVFIPMRDGVRLATDIYRPSGAAARRPVVLIRTPYGKDQRYGQLQKPPGVFVQFFVDHGYTVAVQDKRGRHHSEGQYVVSGGDDKDGYDTVDWLSKQPWSNGNIGTYGCSYDGDVQIFMAQTRHPALKAMIPQASGSSVGSLGGHYRYFGVRVGGSAEWVGNLGWFSQYGEKVFPRLPTTLKQDEYNAIDGLWQTTRRADTIDLHKAWVHLPSKDALSTQGMPPTDFEDNLMRAPTDPYWNTLPYMTDQYRSDVPTLFINSWFDFGADMTMVQFNHFRRHSMSPQARENQFVIMSPHTHCAFEREAGPDTRIGELNVGDTRFDYRSAYLTWFDAWLKNDAEARRRIAEWPKLRYYAMGRNRWQTAEEWPLKGTKEKQLFLGSAQRANSLDGDGVLTSVPAAKGSSPRDTYTYDPANPVPSKGGGLCCTGTPDALPGSLDQRSVEARSDVLVFTSPVLEKEMEVTGDVRVVLHVSSDAVDTDFTAKLVEVYPDGRALNLLESVLRARYREGQHKVVWMKAGEHYELTIPLGAISNVFQPGHRIRLEVSSSNFPRFERNLNLGGNNSEQSRWSVAKNTIHHTPELKSRLILPVVER